MTHRRRRTLIWLITIVGPVTLAGQKVSAPAPDGSVVIEAAQPMDEATRILADRYGVPITFEEPKWLWNGDFVFGRWVVGDPPRFVLPGRLYPDETPSAETAVHELVDAYNAQEKQGIRFQVQKSRLGLHVVPSQFHGADGKLAPAASVLDVPVTVPAAERMAKEHLVAICEAVSRITGVRLLVGSPWGGLGQLFAANGVIAPRDANSRPAEERKMYSFLWGSSGTSARDAVSALFEESATTLRWFLRCDPAVTGDPRFCVLNVAPLMERVTTADGKLRPGSQSLVFDRVASPPVPAPVRTQ